MKVIDELNKKVGKYFKNYDMENGQVNTLVRGNNKERDMQIISDRYNGLTYSKIAKKYSISYSRARQIFRRYCYYNNISP